MSCYLSSVIATKPTKQWPYRRACKLCCDRTAELTVFAKRMELRPEWIQDPQTEYEHYDLTVNAMQRALNLGAVHISNRDLVALWDRKRAEIAAGKKASGLRIRAPGILGIRPGRARRGKPAA